MVHSLNIIYLSMHVIYVKCTLVWVMLKVFFFFCCGLNRMSLAKSHSYNNNSYLNSYTTKEIYCIISYVLTNTTHLAFSLGSYKRQNKKLILKLISYLPTQQYIFQVRTIFFPLPFIPSFHDEGNFHQYSDYLTRGINPY